MTHFSPSTVPADLPTLPRQEVRRAMRISLFEGMLYAWMVGCAETYFVADVVRLHGSPLEIGLVAALPLFIGGIGALFGIGLLHRLRSRKRLCVWCVAMQAFVLLGLVTFHWLGIARPLHLIVCVSLYQVCGQLGGTSWSSWYGDLVPTPLRGRYFAQRTRLVHLTTFVGIALAGTTLRWLEPEGRIDVHAVQGGQGFLWIYAVGALARIGSALLLAASPEPHFEDPHDSRDMVEFLKTRDGGDVLRIFALAACANFSVYLASPFFSDYMLTELNLDYLSFMIATATVVVAKFVFMPSFGRSVDRHGAAPVFKLALWLIALTPLPWLFFTQFGVILFAQMLSGFAWSGHEISYFTLLLESSNRHTRARIYSIQSLLNGFSQCAGSVCGALILQSTAVPFRGLFTLSSAARLLCALLVPLFLAGIPDRSGISRGRLLLDSVGLRSNTGLGLRPVEEPQRPRSRLRRLLRRYRRMVSRRGMGRD